MLLVTLDFLMCNKSTEKLILSVGPDLCIPVVRAGHRRWQAGRLPEGAGGAGRRREGFLLSTPRFS